MKLAVTGKGGVGKTTLAAVLAGLYAREGRTVLAADVDPDANLGLALGFSEAQLSSLTPISKMAGLISERTGADSENSGKFFKLNPKVDDIPDRFSIEKDGVRLLVMGTVETGGGGCVCPEHVMLKRVVSHLVIARDDVVIMDMEAGLEHLGRGTAGMVDRIIVVTEPGARSVQTYHQIKRLAADLGVRSLSVVGNKLRSDADRAYLEERLAGEELLGFMSFSDSVADADKAGVSLLETSSAAVGEIMKIKERIDETSDMA
jgi:CO dehydrogenase maturation factor